MSKFFCIPFTVCFALATLVGTVQAGIVSSIVANGQRIHGLQDTSADVGVRFNAGTGTYQVLSGTLAVGDYLAAGIGFDTMERGDLVDAPLSGAAGFSILKIGSLVPFNPGLSTFTFVAPTVAEWSGIVDNVFGGAVELKKSGAGTLLNLYDNASQDFDRIAPPANLAASAATLFNGGSKLAELGFSGPANGNGNITPNGMGEGWEATGPNAPATGSVFPLNTNVLGSSFSASLNRISGFGGFTFVPILSSVTFPTLGFAGKAEFVGGGVLQGYGDAFGNPVGPWQIGDDADFSFVPNAIPEPTSLLIFGAFATGIVVVRRRRVKAAC